MVEMGVEFFHIFPVITKEKQRIYEKMYLDNEKFESNVPCICGYYGRACRQMNNKTDRMLCNGCELSIFVSTLEAILEVCNNKEKIGIKSLYDSDICIKHRDLVSYTFRNGEIHKGYVTALYPELNALNFQSPTKHCKKVNAKKCRLLWKYNKIYWLDNVL